MTELAPAMAWAIGLFEGEGTITIRQQRVGRCYGGVELSLETTDEDVIRRLPTAIGMGTVTGPHHRPSRPEKKLTWRWRLGKEAQIRELLVLWVPHLGTRRRARALEALRELDDVALLRRVRNGVVVPGHPELFE